MNITPIQNNNQNTTAFKMNLKFESFRTRKLFERDLNRFYNQCVPAAKEKIFGNEPYSPKKAVLKLQRRFSIMTENVKGTVKIARHKTEKPTVNKDLYYNFICTDMNGKTYKSLHPSLASSSIPNEICDKGQPYRSAVSLIVACIADSVAHSGVGYGKGNWAMTLYEGIK